MSKNRLKKLEDSLALNIEKVKEIDIRFINPDGSVGSVLKIRHSKACDWVEIREDGQ